MNCKHTTGIITSMVMMCLALVAPAVGSEYWVVTGGTTTVMLDEARLADLDLELSAATQWSTQQSVDRASTLSLEVDNYSNMTFTIDENDKVTFIDGKLRHVGGIDLVGRTGDELIEGFAIQAADDSASLVVSSMNADAGSFVANNAVASLDRSTNMLLVRSSDLRITEAMAQRLGAPHLAGELIGSLAIQAEAVWTGGDVPEIYQDRLNAALARGVCTPHNGNSDGNGGVTTCCQTTGPDVIVGVLPELTNWTAVGEFDAISVGTTSCNLGDTPLLWQSSNTNHPVIGQNMYRLKNNRFEQIGMSWLKHGFLALANDSCGCGCQNPGTGALLGIGCSDPYSSGLNGSQTGSGGTGGLGPRFEVNPHTGSFNWPYAFQGQGGNTIYKRLQFRTADIDPALNPGALYFVEGQYVTPDDAAANNNDNNASYRQVSTTESSVSMNGMPSTVREKPAIRAWKINDSSVMEVDVRAQDTGGAEGLIIMAGKATNLGGGQWHYEYAIHNLNSHRGVASVTIPFPAGTSISNAGFHDVDYHDGDGEGGTTRSGTDWTITIGIDQITWNTQTAVQNNNANALLWGTTYNFRFDANVGPDMTEVELGYFRSGGPSSALVEIIGPPQGPGDCQPNGIPDPVEIGQGSSQDCNGNLLPDECEVPPIGNGPDCNLNDVPDECELEGNDCNANNIPDDCEADCNGNSIADECDIASGSSNDCDGNGVPDDCQADCDNDGTPDTCEVGIILFEDDFETDKGWTVTSDPSLTGGEWERGDPIKTQLVPNTVQPEDDHTDAPGTMCYVTDATGPVTSQSDVDGGPTRLTSPSMDLSIGGATLKYWYWFFSGASGAHNPDTLVVEVSTNDGATWTQLTTHSTNTTAWQYNSILVDNIVTPTATMKFRFSVSDPNKDSFTEALIDDVMVTIPDCPKGGDCDDDGDVDADDAAMFVDCMSGLFTAPTPTLPLTPLECLDCFDTDDDGSITLFDFCKLQEEYTGSAP
ncbi:MAG: hypothetical protein H6817_01305 [Phycisphaerales bacterium]|nr:hypothetical protein [Phycisphaerales bacterium]